MIKIFDSVQKCEGVAYQSVEEQFIGGKADWCECSRQIRTFELSNPCDGYTEGRPRPKGGWKIMDVLKSVESISNWKKIKKTGASKVTRVKPCGKKERMVNVMIQEWDE